MSTGKRNIREVIDACRDRDGAENANSSLRTGWTDHYVAAFPGLSGINLLFYVYNVFKDSNNQYPHQDETNVTGGGAQLGTALTDTGLKHLQHQMQAMKGFSWPSNLATDTAPWYFPPSSIPSSGSVLGVENSNGLYKQNDISMGGMRGLEYHSATNSIWVSTSGTAEHLEHSGEISIGSTS